MKTTHTILYTLFAFFCLNSFAAFAQKPKAVVVINVENMRPEYLQRYYYNFLDGGLKRLLDEGTLCTNVRNYINDQNTEAATASLFTGSYPALHGMVNAEWLNRVNNKMVNAFDNRLYQTVGGDSDEGRKSAEQLLCNTLGDELKLSSNGRSKVYSVSSRASTAILSAGHAADGAFWMESNSGNMISSSYYIDLFPFWALAFNNKKRAYNALDSKWEMLFLNQISYKASTDDYSDFEKGFYRRTSFPYDYKKIYDQTGDYSLFRHTPEMNTIITDFAIELFNKTFIGNDEHTDLLMVNYSSLGGAFGPQAVETEDFYIRLDRDLARLITHVKEALGTQNVLVVLSSVCAESYAADYLASQKLASGVVRPDNIVALLRSFLHANYGSGNWIQEVVDQEIYLNRDFIKDKGVNYEEMVKQSAELINQFAGIDVAVPSNIFLQGDFANGRLKSMSNSYNFQRSGDLSFSILPSWQTAYKFQNKLHTNDNRTTLLFWGAGVERGKLNNELEAIDMVPTILNLLGEAQPQSCQGKVIEL
ncbi:MAG: alkaline phosphatase family protein [Mangrovibacterium sp.]